MLWCCHASCLLSLLRLRLESPDKTLFHVYLWDYIMQQKLMLFTFPFQINWSLTPWWKSLSGCSKLINKAEAVGSLHRGENVKEKLEDLSYIRSIIGRSVQASYAKSYPWWIQLKTRLWPLASQFNANLCRPANPGITFSALVMLMFES